MSESDKDAVRERLVEANGWRLLAEWYFGWPRRLNGAQLAGAACVLTGDSDAVQDMVIRLSGYLDGEADHETHQDRDYATGVFLWLACECEDEARALAKPVADTWADGSPAVKPKRPAKRSSKVGRSVSSRGGAK